MLLDYAAQFANLWIMFSREGSNFLVKERIQVEQLHVGPKYIRPFDVLNSKLVEARWLSGRNLRGKKNPESYYIVNVAL